LSSFEDPKERFSHPKMPGLSLLVDALPPALLLLLLLLLLLPLLPLLLLLPVSPAPAAPAEAEQRKPTNEHPLNALLTLRRVIFTHC
jgi:hypothetical protein